MPIKPSALLRRGRLNQGCPISVKFARLLLDSLSLGSSIPGNFADSITDEEMQMTHVKV
jgi:hypothetical protein